MSSKKSQITGWVISLLLAALLMFMSAGAKLVDWEGKAEAFAELGYSTDVMFKIGVVEAIVAVLFVIPRTGFLGAVLLTGFLGGATATHVRIGDPFFIPIIVSIVAWIALGLRQPDIFRLAIGSSSSKSKPDFGPSGSGTQSSVGS